MLDKMQFVVYTLHCKAERRVNMINRVAEFRLKLGMTQEELAEKSGVSRPYISEIETGSQKVISNVVMLKIANALNESVNTIFFS